jgi:anti-sigma B factor antagonist
VSDPVQLRTARPAPGVVVLSVVGEIDIVTAPDLEDAIAHEVAATPAHLVIDLSGVTFFGSLGLATLIRTVDALEEHRAVRLTLVVGRHARRTMELTKTVDLFVLHDSVEAALGPE